MSTRRGKSNAGGFANRASNTRLLRGALFIVMGGICWGFSGTCIEYLTRHAGVTVEWASTLRLSIAAVILMALCLVLKRDEFKQLAKDRSSWRDILLYAVFGCFGCQITYMYTISIVTAGIATLMEQLGLVMVVFWVCLRTRRAPKLREIAALLLAFSGLFCICTQGNLSSLAVPPEGLFWGVTSMFTMALYILIPVRLMAKWSGLVVTAPCITIAALVAALVLQPWHTAFPLTLGAIAGVLATAIFGVVVSYLLFLKGLREAGAVVGGLLDSVEPVAAMGFSALLLGTPITNFDAIGALLIISMMVLVALPEKKPDAGGALDAGMKPNASEITDADMKPSAVPSPQEPI